MYDACLAFVAPAVKLVRRAHAAVHSRVLGRTAGLQVPSFAASAAGVARGAMHAAAIGAALLACLATVPAGMAQAEGRAAVPPPAPPPLADPQQFLQAMFEQFLGEGPQDEQALAHVSVSLPEEQRFGLRTAQAYRDDLERRKIRVASRGKEVRYLQQLVETIRGRMKNRDRYRRIQVYVVDTPSSDAHCVPGGTLFFDRGLLEFAGSEAALVGIVGHELSHLDHGHQLKMLRRVKLAEGTFAGGKGVSVERFLQSGALLLRNFLRPCSPADESAADRDGAVWGYEAGYDPRELADLFARLERRQPEGPPAFPVLLRTHPPRADRRRAILDLFGQLQARSPKDKLYIGRENLRRRVTRAEREFEE